MTTTPAAYYVLDGHEPKLADFEAWCGMLMRPERVIAQTIVAPGTAVSTVFIGIDHPLGRRPPRLFETMLFNDYGGFSQRRYNTWGEAEAGHLEVVAETLARLAPE